MKPLKYVYFISCQGYGYDGFFKLGVTSDYKRRYSEISKNIPFFTVLSCVVEHSNPLDLEYKAFEEFKTNIFKGEWFYTIPRKCFMSEDLSYRDYMDQFMREHKLFETKVINFLCRECNGRIIKNG